MTSIPSLLKVRDLATGTDLPDTIESTGGMVWAAAGVRFGRVEWGAWGAWRRPEDRPGCGKCRTRHR